MMKTILNKIKYVLITLMALAFITSIALFSTSVKAESYSITSIESFKMLSGGSIRINTDNTAEVNGIRFTVTLSKTDRETLLANVGDGKTYESVETGVIILPKSYLGHEIKYGDGTSNPSIANLFGSDENEAIYGWAEWDETLNDGAGGWSDYEGKEVQIININNQHWHEYTYTENSTTVTAYKYTGSISGIVTGNITREFYSCAYMRAKLANVDAYDYVISDGTTTSANYIANKAVDDWADQITEIDTLLASETDDAVIAELTQQKTELESQKSSMTEKYITAVSGNSYTYTVNIYTQNDNGSYSLNTTLTNTSTIGSKVFIKSTTSGTSFIVKYGTTTKNATNVLGTLPFSTEDYVYESAISDYQTSSLQVNLHGNFNLYYKKSLSSERQITSATDELEAAVPSLMYDKVNGTEFNFKALVIGEANYTVDGDTNLHLYKISAVTGEKTEIEYLPDDNGFVDISDFEGIYRFVAVHKTTTTTEYVINVEIYNSEDGIVWAPYGTSETASHIVAKSTAGNNTENAYDTPVYNEDLDMYSFSPNSDGNGVSIYPVHSQAYYNMFIDAGKTLKLKLSYAFNVNGANTANGKVGVSMAQCINYTSMTANWVNATAGTLGTFGSGGVMVSNKVTDEPSWDSSTSIFNDKTSYDRSISASESAVFTGKVYTIQISLSTLLTNWNKLFLNEGRTESGYNAWGNRANDFMVTTYAITNYNQWTYTAQNVHNFVMGLKWEIVQDTTTDFNALTNISEEFSSTGMVDLSTLSSTEKASFNLLDTITSTNKEDATNMVAWADTVSLSIASHMYAGVSTSLFTYTEFDPTDIDLNDMEKGYYDYVITCTKGSVVKTITGAIDLYDLTDGVVILPTEEKYIPNVIVKNTSSTEVPTITVEDGMFKAQFTTAKTESGYVGFIIRPLHSLNYYNLFYDGTKDSDGLPSSGYVFTYDYKFHLADGLDSTSTAVTASTILTTGYNFFAGYPRTGKGDGTSSGTWQTQLRRDVKLTRAFYYDVLVDNFSYLATDAVNGIIASGSSALLTTVGNHTGVVTIWLGNLVATHSSLATFDYSTQLPVLSETNKIDKGDAGLIDVNGETTFDVNSLLTQKAGYNSASNLSYLNYYEKLYGKADYVLIDRGGNETKLDGSVLTLTDTNLREYTYEIRIGDAVLITGTFDLYDSEAVPVWNYADDYLVSYVSVVRRSTGRADMTMTGTNPRGPVITRDGDRAVITNLDTGAPAYYGILPVHSKEYYELFKSKSYIFNYTYQASAKIYSANYGYFGSNAGGTEADLTGGKTVSIAYDTMMSTYYDVAFGDDFVTSQKTGGWNAWGSVSMLGLNQPNAQAGIVYLTIPKVTLGLSSFTKVEEEMTDDNLINLDELTTAEKQNFDVLSLVSASNVHNLEVLLGGVDSVSVTFSSLYGSLTPTVFSSTTVDLTTLEKVAYKVSITASQLTTSNKEVYVGYVDLYSAEDGLVWLPVDAKYVSYIIPYESGTSWGTSPSATVTVEDGLYKVAFTYGSSTASWMHVARALPLHSINYYNRAYIGDTSLYSNGTTTKYDASLSYSYTFKYTVADGQDKNGNAVTKTSSSVINLHQFNGYPLSSTGGGTYHAGYAYGTEHTFTVPYDLIIDSFANLTLSWTNNANNFFFYQTANASGNTTLYFGNFNVTAGSTALYTDDVDVEASTLDSYDLMDAISTDGDTAIEVATALGTPSYVFKKGDTVLDSSVIDLTDYASLGDYTLTVSVGGKPVYEVSVSIADSTLATSARVDTRYTELSPKLVEVSGITSYDIKSLLTDDDKAVVENFEKYTAEYVLIDYVGNETNLGTDGVITTFAQTNKRAYKVEVRTPNCPFVLYTTYVDFYLESDGLVWIPSGAEYVDYVQGVIVAGKTVQENSCVTTYVDGKYVLTFNESAGNYSNSRSAKIIPIHSKAYYEANCTEANPCELEYTFSYSLEDGATVTAGTFATFRWFAGTTYHNTLSANTNYTLNNNNTTLYYFVSNWNTYMNMSPLSSDSANQGTLIRSFAEGAGVMVMKISNFHFIQQATLTTEYYFETAEDSGVFAIDSNKTTAVASDLGDVVADVKAFDGYNYDFGNANEVITGNLGLSGLTLKVYYKVNSDTELVNVNGLASYNPFADIADEISAWNEAGRTLTTSIVGIDGHVVSGTSISATSANYMIYTATITYNDEVIYTKVFDLYDSALAPVWDTVNTGDISRAQAVDWANNKALTTADYVSIESVDDKNYYVFRIPATSVSGTYNYQLFGLTPLHSKDYYTLYRNAGYFFTYEYKVVTENNQKHSQIYFNSTTNIIYESGFALDTIFVNKYSIEDVLDTYWDKFTDSLTAYKAAGSPWGAKEYGLVSSTGSDTYYIDIYLGEFKVVKYSSVTTEYYKETSANSGVYEIDNTLTENAYYPAGSVGATIKTISGYTYDFGNANEVIFATADGTAKTLKVYYNVSVADETELITVTSNSSYDLLSAKRTVMDTWEANGRTLTVSLVGIDGTEFNTALINTGLATNLKVYTLTVKYGDIVLYSNTFDLYNAALAPVWSEVSSSKWNAYAFNFDSGNAISLDTVSVVEADDTAYYRISAPASSYYNFTINPLHTKAFYENYRGMGYEFSYTLKEVTVSGQFYMNSTTNIMNSRNSSGVYVKTITLEELLDNQWDWIFDGANMYDNDTGSWSDCHRGKVGMFSTITDQTIAGEYDIGEVKLTGTANVNVNVYTETAISSGVYEKNNEMSYVLQNQELYADVSYDVPTYILGYQYVSNDNEVLSTIVNGTNTLEVYYNKVQTGTITISTYLEQDGDVTGSYLKDSTRTTTVTLNKGVHIEATINGYEKEVVIQKSGYQIYYVNIPTISGYNYQRVTNKVVDYINGNWYNTTIKLYYLIADRDIGAVETSSTPTIDITDYIPTTAPAVAVNNSATTVDVTFTYALNRIKSDNTLEVISTDGLITDDVLTISSLEGKYVLTITDSEERVWTLSFESYNIDAPYWNEMNLTDLAVAKTGFQAGPSYQVPTTTGLTTTIVDAADATAETDSLLSGKTGKFAKVVFDGTSSSANLVFNLFPVHDLSIYDEYVGKGYVLSYDVYSTATIRNTSLFGYRNYAMRWSYEVINTWRAAGVTANSASATVYSVPFDSYIVSKENRIFNATTTEINLNRFTTADNALNLALGRFEIASIAEGDTVYIGNVRVEKMIDHIYCSTTAVTFDVHSNTTVDMRDFLTEAQREKYDYYANNYTGTNITWHIDATDGTAIEFTANKNTAPILDLVANKEALASGPVSIYAKVSGYNGVNNTWLEMRFINTANTGGAVKCVTFTNLPDTVEATLSSADSTVKVLQDTVYDSQDDIYSDALSVNAFKGERESTQLIIRPTTSVGSYNVTIEDLTDGNSNTLSASNINIYHEMYSNIVVVKSPYITTGTGDYPDALVPLASARAYNVASIDANTNQGVWIEINVPESQVAGTYTGTVTVTLGTSTLTKTLTVVVYDYTLSSVQHLATKFGLGYDSLARLEGEKVVTYSEDGKETVSYVLSDDVTDAYYEFLLDYNVSATTTGSSDTADTYFVGWMGRAYNPDYIFDTSMVTINGNYVHQYEYPLVNADGTSYGSPSQYDYNYATAKMDAYIDEMIKAVNDGATSIQIPVSSSMAINPDGPYATSAYYGSVGEMRSDVGVNEKASVINQLILRTFMERMYKKSIDNNVDIFAISYLYPVWIDEYSCSASKTLNAQRMLTYMNGFFDKMADYLTYKYASDADYSSSSALATQLIASIRDICIVITGENLDPFDPETLQSVCGTAEPVVLTNVCFCPIIDKYNNETLRDEWSSWSTTSGSKQWVYTAISPLSPYPTHHIADALLSTRAISWMMYNYDIEGYLYWSTINAQYQDSCYLLDSSGNKVKGLTDASGNYIVDIDGTYVTLLTKSDGTYYYVDANNVEHTPGGELDFVVCYKEDSTYYYNNESGVKTVASYYKDILLSQTYMDVDEFYSNAIHYQNAAGEGYLVYPGSKFGITGPIGTVRLQAFSDGVEEYNMLYALEQMYETRNTALGASSDVDFDSVMARLTEQIYTGSRMNYSDGYVENFSEARLNLMNMIVLANTYGIVVDNYTMNANTGAITFTVSAPTSLGDLSSYFIANNYTYETATVGDYTVYTLSLRSAQNNFTFTYEGLTVDLSVLKLRETFKLESDNIAWASISSDSSDYKTYLNTSGVNTGSTVEVVTLAENELNGNVAGSYYRVSPTSGNENAMIGFTLLPEYQKSYYAEYKDYANLVFDVYISVEDANSNNIIDYRLFYTFGFPNNTQTLTDRCWFTLSIPLSWIYENWDSIVNSSNISATSWSLTDKALFTLYGAAHNDGSEISRFYIGNFRIEHE